MNIPYVVKFNNKRGIPMTALSKKEDFPLSDIESKKELLKKTICKGATDDEFELFIHACKRTGLDPFMKQIHAVKRFNSKTGREEMTIQTGIDGFRLIAERTGRYSPGKEAVYAYDGEGFVLSATASIKKQTPDGTWHEISATAFWEEYVQKSREGKPTQFWARMPHLMLAKCAESLALRKAFPAELSGIYTHEEMAQAAHEVNSEVETQVEVQEDLSQKEERFLEEWQIDILADLGAKNPKKFKSVLKKFGSLAQIPFSKFNEAKKYLAGVKEI